jgi:hypothetical protein
VFFRVIDYNNQNPIQTPLSQFFFQSFVLGKFIKNLQKLTTKESRQKRLNCFLRGITNAGALERGKNRFHHSPQARLE